MKRPAGAATLLALCSACAGVRAPGVRPAADAGPREVAAGCPPERAARGEARLVFLGDSGYGTGSSEWGTPGQEAIAGLINHLDLPPDLVFMLGDNVYWTGSEDLYKARFDDMYDPLIRQCKVHVALGNHDVKGCRAAGGEETAGDCVEKLEAALAADRAAQYLRQGMTEEAAREKAEQATPSKAEEVPSAQAFQAFRANCLPSDASAYKDQAAGQCHAPAALRHAQFGFGAADAEGPVEERRQRYYKVPWPVPRLPDPATGAAEPSAASLVEVLVADSNTLHVQGGLLAGGATPGLLREDRLQMLWLRSALAAPSARGGSQSRGPWKIVTMHHSPYTPRACACKLFGHCFGGHDEDPGLQGELREALTGADAPDLFISAHNHIYARTHPLDAAGQPVLEGSGGLRYFVTGGGGGPLYAVDAPDSRFASALTMYHFLYLRLTATAAFFWAVDHNGQVRDSGCFERGSNVDRPLSRDFGYADPLPSGCAPPQG